MSGENQVAKIVQDNRIVAGGVTIGDKTFGVVNQVNVPTLKHDTDEIVTIRIEARIVAEKKIEMAKVKVDGVLKEVEQEKTIHVVRVTELSSGKPFNYVCNAMTVGNLNTSYPDDGYVGKSFAIHKLGRVQGKMYKEVSILEIAPIDPETGEVAE